MMSSQLCLFEEVNQLKLEKHATKSDNIVLHLCPIEGINTHMLRELLLD